ncbi:MAG: alpha/beta hydrolase domain-containing protein, partial [Mycetocola sp.]
VASEVGNDEIGHTFFASDLLAGRGYVEEEYFYSGSANVYDATVAGGIGSRSTPSPTANIVSSGHDYTTRLVVRKPSSSAAFNGTVVVEWLNATSNYDLEALWFRSHEQLIRNGYAWVGITAQSGPITNPQFGLKQFDPARYGELDLTDGGTLTSGDPLAFDAFGQGIQAVRHAGVLGDLQDRVGTILAAGVSQSAGRLSVFTNAILSRGTPVADGVLLYTGGEKMRDDLAIPVFKVLSESERAQSVFDSLQPDTDRMRTWHIAGTTHADWQSLIVRYPQLILDQPTAPLFDTCADGPTRSRIPAEYVWAAAIDHLVKWVDGEQPPTAPALFAADGTIPRDARGNATGGLRLAPVVVPTALATGVGCGLNGIYRPFDTATLNELYPDRDSYLTPFLAAVNENVADGYISDQDGQELSAKAQASIFGLGLTCEAFCANVSQFPLYPSTQSLRDQTAAFYLDGGSTLVNLLDRATAAVAQGQTRAQTLSSNYKIAISALRSYQQEVSVLDADGRASDVQARVLFESAQVLIDGLDQAIDKERPVVSLASPTTNGPFAKLDVRVDASDAGGLQRIVANVYQGSKLIKSTQTALAGATVGTHVASVSLPDGEYTLRYNAQDLAGNISVTGTQPFTIDSTKPTVTVKDGSTFTVGANGVFDIVSFKLFDAGKIDKVTLNGQVKDLTNNAWSDVNFVKPAVFGAVRGANTLVVYDVAGNSTSVTFTLN